MDDTAVLHGALSQNQFPLKGTLSGSGISLDGSLNGEVRAGGFTASDLRLGHALIWDGDGRLAVEVASSAETDNTLPITSAAVQTALGNIDVLLKTI